MAKSDSFRREYIFSFNHHQTKADVFGWILQYLNKELRNLLKEGWSRENAEQVRNISAPCECDCHEQDCTCRFVFPGYHFLICLDKKSRKNLDKDKAKILKILNNKNFPVDFLGFASKTREEMGRELCREDFLVFLAERSISAKYAFMTDYLLKEGGWEELLQDPEKALIKNITYKSYYNKLVYCHREEDSLCPELGFSRLMVEYEGSISKKEMADTSMQEYFRKKYFDRRERETKFDFDKYHRLMRLDQERPEMTDCEKADIVLERDVDLETGPLPSPEEDKRKIAVIRTMRRRYKKYLEDDT
jgi:hypothetical protein